MRPSRNSKSLRAAVLVLVVAVAVSGCGRRGRLEPPPDPNAPPVDDAATTKSGIHKRKPNPPIRAPDQPFILDPILQ